MIHAPLPWLRSLLLRRLEREMSMEMAEHIERSMERYSARSASIGCTRSARRVGTTHARVQIPSITIAYPMSSAISPTVRPRACTAPKASVY